MKNKKLLPHNAMRVYHRYLGFFLAGMTFVYAISGIVMIFRNTDIFKKEIEIIKELKPNLSKEKLRQELRIKKFEIIQIKEGVYFFKEGTYNSTTGIAQYKQKKLPFILDKFTHLHKATTQDTLYWLNIFFGVAFLFFVLSSFWMFTPKSTIFKKGMYFVSAGILLTLILLFV